jgi:hypothetical protein
MTKYFGVGYSYRLGLVIYHTYVYNICALCQIEMKYTI